MALEIEALHAEMKLQYAEIRRDLDTISSTTKATNGRVRDLELWRAQAKGFLLALGLVSGLPTVILGWIALSQFGNSP